MNRVLITCFVLLILHLSSCSNRGNIDYNKEPKFIIESYQHFFRSDSSIVVIKNYGESGKYLLSNRVYSYSWKWPLDSAVNCFAYHPKYSIIKDTIFLNKGETKKITTQIPLLGGKDIAYEAFVTPLDYISNSNIMNHDTIKVRVENFGEDGDFYLLYRWADYNEFFDENNIRQFGNIVEIIDSISLKKGEVKEFFKVHKQENNKKRETLVLSSDQISKYRDNNEFKFIWGNKYNFPNVSAEIIN